MLTTADNHSVVAGGFPCIIGVGMYRTGVKGCSIPAPQGQSVHQERLRSGG